MNTRKVILVSFCFFFAATGFSQEKKVKDKFRDQNGQTINVVKDEKASDQDILNEQFDLASIGMNEEVKIYRNQNPDLNVKPAKSARTTEQALSNSTTSAKSGYVPRASSRRVKTKKIKLKKRRKHKRYRGFCFAF